MSRGRRLSSDELKERFVQLIVPEFLESAPELQTAARPSLVLVAAQPGAGKSRLISTLLDELAPITAVNGDDYRIFDPRYDELMRTDPVRMPQVTGHAAGEWQTMAVDYLRQAGRSVMLETSLRRPEQMAELFDTFRADGYATVLYVMAVPAELSKLGTVRRYIDHVREFGGGRWADSKFHNATYTQLPESVAYLQDQGSCDTIIVTDRQSAALYDSRYAPQGATAAAALAEGRQLTSITPAVAVDYLAELAHAAQWLASRPLAPEDIHATVRELAEAAPVAAAIARKAAPRRAASTLATIQQLTAPAPEITPLPPPAGPHIDL